MTLPAPLILSLSKDMPAHRAFPNVTYAQLRAELQREADYRRRTFPQLVAKGNMTEAEAAHQHAILTAIAQDLEAVIAFPGAGAFSTSEPAGMETPLPGRDNWGRSLAQATTKEPSFTWHDKRACLQRELAQRARFYPGWIAKGNMTAPAGAHQVDCLQAMLAIYGEGWGWRAANGFPPAWGGASPTPEQTAARAEWRETSAALDAQRPGAQQALMI